MKSIKKFVEASGKLDLLDKMVHKLKVRMHCLGSIPMLKEMHCAFVVE